MPPSRLLQGSNRRPRPSGASTTTSAAVLPPYEPPAQPLGDVGKRSLSELASNRETRAYQQHLAESTTNLRNAVFAINEHLFNVRSELSHRQERSDGNEKNTEIVRDLQQQVAKLEATVAELTNQSEGALREVIDSRAELEDEKDVFGSVIRLAAAQKPRVERRVKPKNERRSRRRAGSGDEDGTDGTGPEEAEAEDEEMPDAPPENEEPLQGLPELMRAQREVAANKYAAMTVHQRYGLHNDYIAFKKMWHTAQHPEDEVPLADASTWFDAQGRPNWDSGVQADDDDELVVERVVTDLKCPLSLQVMKEPYSNRKCKHTFEKSAILEFLQHNRGTAKCPVCSQVCCHRTIVTLRIVPEANIYRR